ncbi:nitrite reductase (NAD(P)H) small subunit [Flavihumibacter sp. RY-1]|uniref:Nitrite reductase (NAD(P)H) small subunit n=1 Tax=Flavihumibacter fluminis TaxID=2909236 RepID=A0ABS9BPV8_9BACT|nr:Rieske 2Fe-2S domain-containing protein [Flavihumibacter fluminis]MCF1716859.1 nitrite reductase (NAD(P)H) small subunit [Flavihumibacter fluminis]
MELNRTQNWVKIAESVGELQFNSNQIALAELEGRPICIGRYKEKLFAFAHKCPHASGLFSEGFIDALGNVVCPLHRYRFSMASGRNVSGEGYYLKHWPVEEREDGVYVWC